MKKVAVLAVIVALLVLGAVAGAGSVSAQPDPLPPALVPLPSYCYDAVLDLDGNGYVSGNDAAQWKTVAQLCIDRDTGTFLSGEACQAIIGSSDFDRYDVNHDGKIDFGDYQTLVDRAHACFTPIRLPR